MAVNIGRYCLHASRRVFELHGFGFALRSTLRSISVTFKRVEKTYYYFLPEDVARLIDFYTETLAHPAVPHLEVCTNLSRVAASTELPCFHLSPVGVRLLPRTPVSFSFHWLDLSLSA